MQSPERDVVRHLHRAQRALFNETLVRAVRCEPLRKYAQWAGAVTLTDDYVASVVSSGAIQELGDVGGPTPDEVEEILTQDDQNTAINTFLTGSHMYRVNRNGRYSSDRRIMEQLYVTGVPEREHNYAQKVVVSLGIPAGERYIPPELGASLSRYDITEGVRYNDPLELEIAWLIARPNVGPLRDIAREMIIDPLRRALPDIILSPAMLGVEKNSA